MRRWAFWISLGGLLGLFALGCGGGGSGGGGDGGTGVTVAVSPKAVLVILNGTQQFFALVSGGKVATIATSNGAVRAANVVTITTTSAHGLSTGQSVTISGVTDSSFNGTFTIVAVPSTTTFTYAQTASDATSGGGSVTTSAAKWSVNGVEGGNTTFGTISMTGLYTAPVALPPATTLTIASSGAVRSNNVVTITTTAAHNLVVGQVVIISGVTDTSFNGTFAVASAPSSTTFTFSQTGSNATSGGGTVTSTAVQVKAVPIADNTKSDTAIVSLDSGVRVTLKPKSPTLGTSETLTFIPTVQGTCPPPLLFPCLKWFVNDKEGGDLPTVGSITTGGLYTAPATVPNPATVTIKAISQADTSRSDTASATIVQAIDPTLTSISPTTVPQGSVFEDISLIGPPATTLTIASNGAVRSNNVVTITTTAAHNLVVGQVVTISGVTDTSFNGTFPVASAPSSTTFTFSQTGSNATSGGGTVASAQTNFIATNVVNVKDVNGTLRQLAPDSVPSSMLLRARIPASLLGAAGILKINVQRQGGTPNPAQEQTLTVVPVRPALVAASPDSFIQGGGVFSFDVHGGYFGDPAAPAVSALVDGGVRAVTLPDCQTTDCRRLSVTVGPPGGELVMPGLVPVAIRNVADPSRQAATNFAVQPSSGATFAVIQTLSLVAGSAPSALAVNTATGTGVVANTGTNTVQLIDLTTNPPSLKGGPIAVGTSPTGVAIDNVRNLAVVVNNGSNSVSIVDLSPSPAVVTATITTNIGPAPVAVAVNPLTGIAAVAYQNSNNLSLIDLATNTVVSAATVSTGPNPQVAVEPKLNWAVITPGGAGSISIVETGKRISTAIAPNGASRTSAGAVTITTTAPHSIAQGQVVLITGVAPDTSFNGTFTVTGVPTSTSFTYIQSNPAAATSGGGQATFSATVATASVGGTTARGISINTETERAVLADPSSTQLQLFSVLDQSVSSITLEAGHVAAAFHPLTDIVVSVNFLDNKASAVDVRTPTRLAQISVGTNPRAVVVDPVSNLALVANAGSNDVSVIKLGALRPLHLTQINIPSNRQLGPAATLTAASSLSLTIVGGTFSSGSAVRLDGDATGVTTAFVGPRRLNVTIDPARLAAPRRYAVDVVDGVNHSNVAELAVIRAVDMVGAGGAACTNPSPRGVAIDAERNLAMATNPNCNNVALIDLATGAISKVVSVGTNPQGVAVDSRLGRAVVTNRGSGNASIVDLTNAGGAVSQTVSVGSEPLGVAIDPGTGLAIVANAGSNDLTTFAADTGGNPTTISSDQRPVAIAIDPQRRIAAVAHATQNNLVLFDLKTSPPTVLNRVSGPQLPTSVVFDPVTTLFAVNSSLGNNIFIVNPDTLQVTALRVGINPTSLGYNYRSGTLISLNTASSTMSVVDFADQPPRVRIVIGTGAAPSCLSAIVVGAPQQFQQPPCGVDIHPRTNLAVFADGDNNRVLLVPLPR